MQHLYSIIFCSQALEVCCVSLGQESAYYHRPSVLDHNSFCGLIARFLAVNVNIAQFGTALLL
jgi:hypothetical protein